MLPTGSKVREVIFLTPEAEEQDLKREQMGNRIKFEVPGFLVYAVVEVTTGQGGD